MPSRNVIKTDTPDTYFHIYARGVNKQQIFLDADDFTYFIYLVARYLSTESSHNKFGYAYPNYSQRLELLAYCQMPNHFHLLVYQKSIGVMTDFMRSLMTSYSRYFNLKYKRTGPLFESRYKASPITTQPYLEHISRYIHLNPRSWKKYKHSSLRFYLNEPSPIWLRPGRILGVFTDKAAYETFVSDYEDHKEMFDEIKHELADS